MPRVRVRWKMMKKKMVGMRPSRADALLVVTSITGAVYPLLSIVSGAVFLVVGATVLLAASKGRYFGTVADYRIIGRTMLVAGGAVLAFGGVVALP